MLSDLGSRCSRFKVEDFRFRGLAFRFLGLRAQAQVS